MAVKKGHQPARGTFSITGLTGRDVALLTTALGLYQTNLLSSIPVGERNADKWASLRERAGEVLAIKAIVEGDPK